MKAWRRWGLNIMCVPEEAGGLGLDSVTQTLIAEQMAGMRLGWDRQLAPTHRQHT